jgi:predicted Na+-dependent transporter
VLRTSGLSACLPVVLLHSFGYLLGYTLPRVLGFNEKTSRTGKSTKRAVVLAHCMTR